ncbi:MAG: retropepsin-like aspartic protease [Erythrobacter sp.]
MSQLATLIVPILAVAGGTALLSNAPQVTPPEAARLHAQHGNKAGERAAILSSARTFQIVAVVNQVPVTFVVDTGASISVLTSADAQRVGARATGVREIRGIGGPVMVQRVLIDIEIAGQTIKDVEAVVASDAVVSLVGMDALHALGTPRIVIR